MLTGSEEKGELVMVEIDSPETVEKLDRLNVDMVERYEDFVLVRTDESSLERLQASDININKLPSRTELSVKGHRFDFEKEDAPLDEDLMIDDYEEGEEGTYIVHLLGPVDPGWREELEDVGVKIINYVPNYAYEVRMTPEDRDRVESLDFVDWTGIYHPGYKIDEDVEEGMISVRVLPSDPGQTIDKIYDIDSEVRFTDTQFGRKAILDVDHLSDIREIAFMNDVYYIQQKEKPRLTDEMATQIIGGGLWIRDDDNDPDTAYRAHGDHGSIANQLGYDGSGVVTAIADTGLGDGTTPDAGHDDFTGRVIGGHSYTSDGSWADGHGHGTHCAGSVGGDTYGGTGETYYNDYYSAQGSAPETELFSVRIFDDSGSAVLPDDYLEVLEVAKQKADAYVHSNSWGGEANGAYDASDAAFDRGVRDSDRNKSGNQPMVVTVAAGNSGPGSSRGGGYTTIGSPGNGKNVITVGATQNYNPNEGVEDPESIAGFSSRGWTVDNRVKPDVVAPGEGIYSTKPDGTYQTMSGTSMANPATAGAAATVVDWYEQNYGTRPSPAMVKSLLINTAYSIANNQANTGENSPYIPNQDEGWGMVNLPDIVDSPVDPILHDQESLIQTGQVEEYEIEAQSMDHPLNITLTWTDKNATGGDDPTLKNDLNLEVISPTGKSYRGNALNQSWSEPNAGAYPTFDNSGDGWDDVNNVENVKLHTSEMESGTYTVKVRGKNVPADANNDGTANQDYALTIYNAVSGPSVNIDSPTENETIRESSVLVNWTSNNFNYNEVRLDGGSWTNVSGDTDYTFSNVADGDHMVEVRSVGDGGETDTDSVNFTVQTVGVEILTPQDGAGFNAPDVTVDWSSDYAEYHEIRKDGGNWSNVGVNTSHDYTGLSEGNHVVDVRATDVADNTVTDSVSFSVDFTSPEISINNPSQDELIGQDTVTVEWDSSDAASGIDYHEFMKDGGSWQDIGSENTHTVENLDDGEHSVSVKAVDTAGNSQTDDVTFTVDTTPPQLEITSPADGEIMGTGSVTVEWSGQPMGSDIEQYETRIDSNQWIVKDMSTEHTFEGLSDGEHTVEVKAVDQAGNSKIATSTFKVDTTPPTIEIDNPGQDMVYNDNEVNVEWTASDDTSGIDYYEVQVNDEDWNEIGTSTQYLLENLDDGDNTVRVKALDEAGLEETDTVTFTVDTEAPQVNITSPFKEQVSDSEEVTVEWTAIEEITEIDQYSVRIDDGDWEQMGGDMAANHTFDGLEDGNHTVTVRATDEAGNSDQTERMFIVDTTPPELSIIEPTMDQKIEESSVTVEWEGSDETSGIALYEVSIDDGEWKAKNELTNHDFQDLDDGEHTVTVRATDGAGIETSESVTFDVDTGSGSGDDSSGDGSESEDPASGSDSWWWIPLVLIALIAAILAIFFLKRRKEGDEEEEESEYPPPQGSETTSGPGEQRVDQSSEEGWSSEEEDNEFPPPPDS
ncbi:MAG: S8 family serine peptidase [Candidatus Thermoplasmatota archaeon]|nr:S8 family serine peptidase [Candidatus Thermoplasmatota archaeon]